MREIRTSGSTRGQWVARTVALCPTLLAQNPFTTIFTCRTNNIHIHLSRPMLYFNQGNGLFTGPFSQVADDFFLLARTVARCKGCLRGQQFLPGRGVS